MADISICWTISVIPFWNFDMSWPQPLSKWSEHERGSSGVWFSSECGPAVIARWDPPAGGVTTDSPANPRANPFEYNFRSFLTSIKINNLKRKMCHPLRMDRFNINGLVMKTLRGRQVSCFLLLMSNFSIFNSQRIGPLARTIEAKHLEVWRCRWRWPSTLVSHPANDGGKKVNIRSGTQKRREKPKQAIERNRMVHSFPAPQPSQYKVHNRMWGRPLVHMIRWMRWCKPALGSRSYAGIHVRAWMWRISGLFNEWTPVQKCFFRSIAHSCEQVLIEHWDT